MKKKMIITFSLLMAILLVVGLTACAPEVKEESAPVEKTEEPVVEETEKPEPEEEQEYHIGVVVADFARDFQNRIMVGMQNTVADFPNMKLDFQDGQSDPTVQTNLIETFITQKKDLIIVTPAQVDSLVPIVSKCNEVGIPVVIVNRALGEGAETLTYVGADDYLGGWQQGQMVHELLGDEGNIVLHQGTLGSSAQINREKGLEDYLAENAPGIKIIARQNNDWDPAKAVSVMQNFLAQFPKGEIDAVVTHGPNDAVSAAETCVNSGRDELKGKVIGFDLPQNMLDAISEGLMYGSILQDPREQGRLAVEVAYGYLSGKNTNIEPEIFTDLPMVTNKNYSNFDAAW